MLKFPSKSYTCTYMYIQVLCTYEHVHIMYVSIIHVHVCDIYCWLFQTFGRGSTTWYYCPWSVWGTWLSSTGTWVRGHLTPLTTTLFTQHTPHTVHTSHCMDKKLQYWLDASYNAPFHEFHTCYKHYKLVFHPFVSGDKQVYTQSYRHLSPGLNLFIQGVQTNLYQ